MHDNDPNAEVHTPRSSVHRRRFLTLLGVGAAGTVAARRAGRTRDPQLDKPLPVTEVDRPPGGMQQIVWSVPITDPVASLTFDDGPDPDFTPAILDILDRYEVKATFFALGYNAVTHPDLLREVVARGHEVGGHGWRHLNLGEVSDAEASREVEHGIRQIERVIGSPIELFRPPYGNVSEAAVRLLGRAEKDVIIWSVARGDLGWRDPKLVAQHIVGSLTPGAIVDLHDGIGRGTFWPDGDNAARLRRRRRTEIAALPAVIESAQERGFRWGTVSELLAARGAAADDLH
jgi:peptidoglycan-N-acetylglucosamine deacetylase